MTEWRLRTNNNHHTVQARQPPAYVTRTSDTRPNASWRIKTRIKFQEKMEEGTKGLDASYKKQQARIKKEETRKTKHEARNKTRNKTKKNGSNTQIPTHINAATQSNTHTANDKHQHTSSDKQNRNKNKSKKKQQTNNIPHDDNRQTIANAKYLKYPSRYDKRQPTTTAATSATDRDTANHKLQTRYYALQVARNRPISITNDTPVTKPQNNRTEKYRNHDTTETTETTQRQQTSKRQKLQEERIQAHATHKKMTGIQT